MSQDTLYSHTQAQKGNVLHFVIPALLLCTLVWFLWRYFQYYIDPDAISYLNITQRYINGDYAHAINAFWSPMGYWLTAMLVKATGWPLFASAIIVNTIPALGIVLSGQLLFHKFRNSSFERWCFGLMSAIFWAYATYYQSFTDAWQFLFLIAGLLILLNKTFLQSPLQWLCIGIIAALSYYGKAYSFYFFPLMILIVTAWKLKAEEGTFNYKKLALILIVSVGVMMLAIAPWIYLIHEKYGIWTSSVAGTLNMSWWLVGTQEFKAGVTVLVPPPYKGSLFYFEDPYLLQGRMAHFWDSPGLFVKQLFRTGYNFISWVSSTNRISSFYFFTWLLCILLTFRKNDIFATVDKKILIAIFLVFPLPYWLLTFDGGRYLWFTIPLVSIFTLDIAEHLLFPKLNKKLRLVFTAVFFITFIVTPINEMKTMFNAGSSEYKIAQQLQKSGVTGGSFASNRSYADGAAKIIRLAWFSQNAWYCHTLNEFSTEEILRDAERYHVKYYFYFYDGTGDDYQLTGPDGQPKTDLTGNSIKGLKVFSLEH
ncbi:MAG: hypothetical protein WC756_11420 [Taibaiella sp.]|jgi:hypothetical protein